MGEIADMMVYGEMCPCGEYLHDDGAAGYQRFCSPQCEEDFGGGTSAGPETTPRTLKRDKVPCPICGKKVAPVGLRQHQRDKHGPVAAILEDRDELRERVEELEAERDDAREQVIAAEAEATALALRVEELEGALLRLLSHFTPEPNAHPGTSTYRSGDIYPRVIDEARALLQREGAEDGD